MRRRRTRTISKIYFIANKWKNELIFTTHVWEMLSINATMISSKRVNLWNKLKRMEN